jgi:chemotaxis protein methyltransferase CheR
VDRGWLIVGASELSQQMFPQFTPVNFPEAIAYRKLYQGSQPLEAIRFEEIVPWQTSGLPHLEDLSKVLPDKENIMFKHDEAPKDFSLSEQEKGKEVTAKAEDSEGEPLSAADSVRALADRGEFTEALALCEKAIAADKLDPAMHYLRAIILQEQNSEAEAIASIRRALYLNSDFILANFVLGNLLVRRGDRRAGKRCFENLLTLLSKFGHQDIVPEADGLTAGRLREIVQATQSVYEG